MAPPTPAEARYACDFCFGPLEVAYDLAAARASLTRASIQEGPASIWRYGALLPDPGEAPVDLGAGWTPLRRATRLAEVLGLRELWLKDDTRNPTGSFKDRVVSVALSSARRLGFTTAACASTGNLATSVAAHAAFIGWPSVTIIPSDLEKSKIAMTAIFGGTVLGVEGKLRRRQSPVRRTGRRTPGLGVRQYQSPPVLRRGLEDAGL